jgi:hypothetical protein
MTGSDFQRQALIRKFVYFGIILVLFLVTLGLRNFPVYGLDAQAEKLSIREQDLGEGDLTGQAVRLSLVGSRGITITCLWAAAQEKQKKHEWNELELIVRSLTKLQPHFIAPWRFQSWNLSYNVSVESDRVKDKYFYITRGIDLAAEGERNNRNNPDLRLDVGYFMQDKIGLADEAHTLRCLLQLSLIDPLERLPSRFRSAGNDQVDNMVEFRDFCEKHPMLVRRLREHLRCKLPEDIVDFLEANQKVPSRFEDFAVATGQDTTPLKPVTDRFPPLPPQSRYAGMCYGSPLLELSFDSPSSQLGDSVDNFAVARAWFCYSQDPLYPANDKDQPRRPRLISTIIFLGYPSRAQHYLAETLEKEGWYDQTGWEIRDWMFPEDKLQGQGPKGTITVGKSEAWAQEAWKKAFEMTEFRGKTSVPPLMLDDKQLKELDPQLQYMYNVNKNLTNFNHFYVLSKVEQTTEAVTARRLFHEAETYNNLADFDQAKPIFENPGALGPPNTWGSKATGWKNTTGWKKLLLDHPDYANEDDVQEETYVFEHHYKHALQELSGPLYKQLVVLNDALGQAAQWPANMPFGMPLPWYSPSIQLNRKLHAQIKGPFDDVKPNDEKFISDDAVQIARDRLGLYDFRPLQRFDPQQREQMMNQMKEMRGRRMGIR